MSNKMLVWEISLAKNGKKKIFKKFHILAEFSIQAAHIVESMIFEEGIFGDSENIEIVGINKVREIKNLVNFNNDDEDHGEPNLDWPYEILEVNKSFPENLKIEFKHSCGNIQKIGWFPWRKLECRDCHKIVEHDQIEEIGGLYIFSEK